MTGKQLADELVSRSAKFHGTAEPALIEAFTQDPVRWLAFLKGKIVQFERFITGRWHVTESQHIRGMRHFSITCAAGCFAVAIGILPHTEEQIVECCGEMFLRWRKTHGSGAIESQQAIATIDDFIAVNQSRITAVDAAGKILATPTALGHIMIKMPKQAVPIKGAKPKLNAAGKATKNKDGTWIYDPKDCETVDLYFIFRSEFQKACAPLDPAMVAKALDEAGRLLTNAGRLDYQKGFASVSLPKSKYYVVRVTP